MEKAQNQGLQACTENTSQESLVHIICTSVEEQMLDSAFQMCDVDGRGQVSASQIIEYLQSVTDPSCDRDQLKCLCNMLDPEEQGILIDLPNFRTVMTQWIAGCYQARVNKDTTKNDTSVDILHPVPSEEKVFSSGTHFEGYGLDVQIVLGERADLMSKLKCLNLANKKLIDQKTKLQKSVEQSEETISHLTEEIDNLKNKLKSSQQAVYHTRDISNELEDLKTHAKSLEEKICTLCSQKKQLEKEMHSLNSQTRVLQDENDKLLSEKETAKGKIDDLTTENSKLMHQLCEYERFLLNKDTLLTEKIIKIEELLGRLEDHKNQIQEIQTENKSLQELLQIAQKDKDLVDPQSKPSGTWKTLSEQSVCMEIEELQKEQNMKAGLLSPLCGLSLSTDLYVVSLIQEKQFDKRPNDLWALTELLLAQLKQGIEALVRHVTLPDPSILHSSETLKCEIEEQCDMLLQRLCCLVNLKNVWETHSSRLYRQLQLNTEKEPSLELMERTTISLYEHSLLPVRKQIVPRGQKQFYPGFIQFKRYMPWFCRDIGCHLHLFWTQLRQLCSLFRLLLILIFATLLFCPIWSGEHFWTVLKEILWPHLQLHYLKPPPV